MPSNPSLDFYLSHIASVEPSFLAAFDCIETICLHHASHHKASVPKQQNLHSKAVGVSDDMTQSSYACQSNSRRSHWSRSILQYRYSQADIRCEGHLRPFLCRVQSFHELRCPVHRSTRKHRVKQKKPVDTRFGVAFHDDSTNLLQTFSNKALVDVRWSTSNVGCLCQLEQVSTQGKTAQILMRKKLHVQVHPPKQ